VLRFYYIPICRRASTQNVRLWPAVAKLGVLKMVWLVIDDKRRSCGPLKSAYEIRYVAIRYQPSSRLEQKDMLDNKEVRHRKEKHIVQAAEVDDP